ncbi:NAD(P)-dependent oxidoreductase [Bordetella avium]|uniref:6-phosphogluconate dehydrogenase NADP-binding domain-containing protein n=1 Tax=Bordetella avium (strain 197N) TaxID=360910 RepID=Q2KV29_BORA1|nr:NAD(P)-dependent oxidoreductase [Bordetella avium]AZY51919.1 hypothetical protein C0J07_04945 [Bordetella avium]RIQ13846.1 NAD(P)-dependent oxidoreductase [Bordetella avium]RIQ17080.1 NAD(P)-dependent oxidoreductase [Bordetella avium]RIQ36194.1 NAD(P)-dependent oxidoreductase [Bordetella avium]RIQ39543.1 NAD(P)-dependent oxidoreductase [Bordetella avium]
MKVSIIGMKGPGGRAARLLLAQRPELDLTVYDRAPERCETLRGLATLAGSAAEALRESQIIVLALDDPREIDRSLKRYSDGAVNVRLAGKQVWDLCPQAGEWGRRLSGAIGQAGAAYRPATPETLPRLIAAAPVRPL